MKKLRVLVSSILLITILSGCAVHEGRPGFGFYDPPSQMKLKSASHWQIIAGDISKGIGVSQSLAGKRIYISEESKSKFGKVFSTALRSALLKEGGALSASPANAAVLQVQVESIRHKVTPAYKPGTLTALAVGISVFRGIETLTAGLNTLTAGLIGGDIYKSDMSQNDRTMTEVVITTSIRDGDAIVYSSTGIYYLDAVDQQLFEEPPPPHLLRRFMLVGGAQ